MRPATSSELVDAITAARAAGGKLDTRGGGSKAAIGRACAVTPLDMTAFSGITDYDPTELVITLGAGTPLADVQAVVAKGGQRLAFDPYDHGPLLGADSGAATIGGVVVAGVAGSLRLSQGGARDHLLGFEGVSGRGQAFVAGAKVVKNVTGYDLPKILAGSWGRLAALTQVTLKVMPAPEADATVVVAGLSPRAAVQAMSQALGSQAEVAAAAYLPASVGAPSRTLLRLQGFGPSVAARVAMLPGEVQDSAPDWAAVRDVSPLAGERTLWRIIVPPSKACGVIEALEPLGAQWLMDWAGGLIWLALEDQAEAVRLAASAQGGHASLIRAPADVRAATCAFHPESPGVAALSERVRRAFDPDGVFETGRF